ncbi:MAG: thiamine-phosphate kinase, partial [Kiritimatiellaeota bacterium]|nr:thiamine-phosphate kinase [Kiritimatiellota bacterium]
PREGNYTTDLVLKSDCVIEGRHFTAGTEGNLIGRKAVGRVLSDIAAMGAAPRWFLVDLVAPPETPLAFIDEVHAGMMELSAKYDFALVGGDTAQGPVFELHIFGVGEVPRGEAVLRSGAKTGDGVYVTGVLGGSFKSGKHLNFEPRVREGEFLRGKANAMIDISDGLASELWHIAEESGVRIEIDSTKIPLADDASVENALYDGEDFELLFTMRTTPPSGHPSNGGEFLKFTRIGQVVSVGKAEVIIDGNELPKMGFDHFKK